MTSFDLSGKVAVITGATGLLGSRYCHALVKCGAKVIAADLDVNTINSRFSDDLSLGSKLFPIKCDVTSEEDVINLFQNTLDREGRVDIVINNAAATGEHLMRSGAVFTSFEDSSLEVWESSVRTNLTGVYLVAREGGKAMLVNGKGSLINVSSTYGVVGPDHRIYNNMKFNSLASYAASKAGVHGLTRWLATYWGEKGIRVNTLVPGGVENAHDPEFVKRYSFRTPLRRMANPQEMVGMILFLSSDLSSYCTGQQYFVDGGWTAV